MIGVVCNRTLEINFVVISQECKKLSNRDTYREMVKICDEDAISTVDRYKQIEPPA